MGATAEVRTYRYLRVAMIVTICGLGTSVLVEHWTTASHCWQTSISAYYYTPAQAMFVGTLIAMGLAMVVIKGNTDLEDALLNGAGMLAPIVAFVPTPYKESCFSRAVTDADTRANVANNITALLVLGVLGLIFTLIAALRDGTAQTLAFRLGYPATLAVFVGVVLWFWLGRDSFISRAHYAAAVPLFGCIVAVAVTNALGFRDQQVQSGKTQATARNRYAFLATAMVVAVALMGGYELVFGWDHGVLFIEATVIALFAAFWVLQTSELWHHTTRPAPVTPPTSPARGAAGEW